MKLHRCFLLSCSVGCVKFACVSTSFCVSVRFWDAEQNEVSLSHRFRLGAPGEMHFLGVGSSRFASLSGVLQEIMNTASSKAKLHKSCQDRPRAAKELLN